MPLNYIVFMQIACEVDGWVSDAHPTGLDVLEKKLELREDGSIANVKIVQHSPVICSSIPCHPQLVIQTRHSCEFNQSTYFEQ